MDSNIKKDPDYLEIKNFYNNLEKSFVKKDRKLIEKTIIESNEFQKIVDGLITQGHEIDFKKSIDDMIINVKQKIRVSDQLIITKILNKLDNLPNLSMDDCESELSHLINFLPKGKNQKKDFCKFGSNCKNSNCEFMHEINDENGLYCLRFHLLSIVKKISILNILYNISYEKYKNALANDGIDIETEKFCKGLEAKYEQIQNEMEAMQAITKTLKVEYEQIIAQNKLSQYTKMAKENSHSFNPDIEINNLINRNISVDTPTTTPTTTSNITSNIESKVENDSKYTFNPDLI